MYWLKSAKPGDVPPIFGHYVATTKVVAAIAAVGPMYFQQMRTVTVPRPELARDLKALERQGILCSYDVPVLRGCPRVYGLNRGHIAFRIIDRLAKKIWATCVLPSITGEVTTPFRLLPAHWHPGKGGPHVWRGNFAGRVLHLLAESRNEIRRSFINESFDMDDYHSSHGKVLDRLEAFGLITSRYESGERFLGLNDAHVFGPELRSYLRWVNRSHFPRYTRLGLEYSQRLLADYYGPGGRRSGARLQSPKGMPSLTKQSKPARSLTKRNKSTK
jgi:DNA-binding transcriptional ArsR family regulator